MRSSGNERESARVKGITLFNQGLYWHAHEAWEAIWLETDPPEKQFVQALIQVAAAWHHVQKGNRRGAVRLARRALALLEPFDAHYWGIDRRQTVEATRHLADTDPDASGPFAASLTRPRLDRS